MVTGLLGLPAHADSNPLQETPEYNRSLVAALAYKVQNDSGVPPVVRGDGGCRAASRCAMCLPTVGLAETGFPAGR